MEEKELKNLLEDEIRSEITKLSSMEPGSAEHQKAADSLATLYKLNIEQTENDRAFMEKCDREATEAREVMIKIEELEERKKDRIVKIIMEGAGLALPLIFYGIWMRKGFKFEETGTYTSTTFRGLFNRFRPTR